jgi:uncharacterized membrane protein
MIYLAIKALHIASVMTFVAGAMILAWCVTADNLVLLRAARRWDRRVTTPALALVWITGPAIAVAGHWFGAVWLMVKLVLVVGLSALHGVLAGTLRRMERGGDAPRAPVLRYAAPAAIAMALAIVALAVLKPV